MYHCPSKSRSSDWEVTPLQCHTLQTRSKIHNNTLQSNPEKKHTANTIEFHPEPLRIILSSVTYPQHPATQTCNCCILVVDFSTWNRVKYTEDSWNEAPKTGSKLNGVSHLFHISPVAPPSHHVRPVASVPSLRAAAVVVLRLDGGAGGQQHLDHLQVAFPSRIRQRPVASGSADDGDTTRKVNGGSCSD
jgi:hypothetical protein